VDPLLFGELREFIAIPSVSADPARRDDVRQAGQWIVDFIRTSGGVAELVGVADSELVVGEFRASRGAADAPTVLCYGHTDVQPPEPLELWESDPFELTLRDGWAYGRGTTDDKGQLWVLLKAAQRLAEDGDLPVNVRFVCDGEEEIGGVNVVDFLQSDDRSADAAIIFDEAMLRTDVPVFDLAVRGLLGFRVRVTTGERDLHSGRYGGAALNAIHVLIRCFDAVLADSTGLLPDALRVGISRPSTEELREWATFPAGDDELRLQGACPLDRDAVANFYLRTWAEPSADVNGITGGKPGVSNTALSVLASGELTIRLAPGQDVDTVGRAAEQRMRDAVPVGADVAIGWSGTPPAFVSPESPTIQLGLEAFEKSFGIRPRLARSGGTLPVMHALAKRDVPVVLTGFGLPDSHVHSPNERFLIRYFEPAIATAAALYRAFRLLPCR
jgi:acetylornithine deacetylase/succinyl-diaminopimelate desuccinylase-like protein